MNGNTTDNKKINMIKTECKSELLDMVAGVEDIEILRDLHTYALRRIHRKYRDYCVSGADYGDMIMEVIGEVKDERLLKYLYTFISEKLKRAL